MLSRALIRGHVRRFLFMKRAPLTVLDTDGLFQNLVTGGKHEALERLGRCSRVRRLRRSIWGRDSVLEAATSLLMEVLGKVPPVRYGPVHASRAVLRRVPRARDRVHRSRFAGEPDDGRLPGHRPHALWEPKAADRGLWGG